MPEKIGVPTGGGIKGALINGAVGAAGGVIYGASRRFLGSGLIGALGGIALAGSVLKDGQGEIVATVLGERMGEELLAGIGTASASTGSTSAWEGI